MPGLLRANECSENGAGRTYRILNGDDSQQGRYDVSHLTLEGTLESWCFQWSGAYFTLHLFDPCVPGGFTIEQGVRHLPTFTVRNGSRIVDLDLWTRSRDVP